MTDAQAVRCRKRLEQFLVDLLEPVGRSERRHWGEVYVRSLLLDGERKSIEPLATRLPEGNVQAMQQFIGQSPWEWNLVWERLGKRMTAELEPDPAWVVDDTGFPKQGTHSVAVERQYSGTLGKTGNCQIAVSVHHVGEQGNVPTGMAAVFAGELGQRCPAAARCGYSGGNRLSQEVGTGTGNHRSDPKVGPARSSGVG